MMNIDINEDCLLFNGFKPCSPFKICKGCETPLIRSEKILYIHTGGLGDIIRCLGILYNLKECSLPGSEFFIVTSPKGKELFQDKIPNSEIYTLDEFKTFVQVLEFDRVYNLDRDKLSSALAVMAKGKIKKGFALNNHGKLTIFNEEAEEIFDLGLNDQKKFFENKIPAHQLMAKAMGVVSDPLDFPAKYGYKFSHNYAMQEDVWIKDFRNNYPLVIGINLGVGPAIPPKGLSFELKLKIVNFLVKYFKHPINIVLLGGEDEKEEATKLLEYFPQGTLKRSQLNMFISDDTNWGAMAIKSLDLLITSDTFALHLGLAFDTKVCSWFGPTHPEEINNSSFLKYVRSSRECSPCWKKKCIKPSCCNNDEEIFLGMVKNIEEFFPLKEKKL